ncbi:angiotensin-converting enzyme-like [Battus philenor]|uniref:angiotensin-converting enzyme-like n=1 Tax=Battus philenor TaxID=42288 RepID=UPI0035CF241C
MHRFLFLIYILKICNCNIDVNNYFDEIDKEVIKFNSLGASIEWSLSTNPSNMKADKRYIAYLKKRITWQQKTCDKLSVLRNTLMLNETQQRQAYILCRGPAYNFEEASYVYSLNKKIGEIFNKAEVCFSHDVLHQKFNSKSNLTDIEDRINKYLFQIESGDFTINIYEKRKYANKDCLNQNNLEKIIRYSRNENVLKWVWLKWREVTGPLIKDLYRNLVDVENRAARRNGYTNIGEFWREELEIPNLRRVCHKLYKSVQPLYMLLHGVVRYFLRKKYGNVVPERGAIPSHLLGNLWTHNWESLSDIIVPNSLNLDDAMRNKNWTVKHITKTAEDFYISLGLPPMTNTFWLKSVFTGDARKSNCHGTAADMFKKDDYRMLYCSGISLQDFNVLHHEMGHIHYYMAYADQPGLFRQANSALHESVGEAITIGAMTPQHLNRLGLIDDSTLYSTGLKQTVSLLETSKNNFETGLFILGQENIMANITTDEILLLKRALNKLPQIPFSLAIDEYRWKYFEGRIDDKLLNEEFWSLSLALQGISVPENRQNGLFDVGAIYHVADNTPFIRYFLSNFLQHNLFEQFCKNAVFNNQRNKEDLPRSITMNRCDIYGAKPIGKNLKNFMKLGNSLHWKKILNETVNEDAFSPEALLRYYQPLQDYLTNIVKVYNIPIGW